MLTFYYDDYRVHIHDTGKCDYVRLDDVPAVPVVVTDPPAAVMAIAAAVLPLIMSDVMKADLRVARLRESVSIATEDVVSADNAEKQAKLAGMTARSARAALSVKLRAAEGALQLASAGEALQPAVTWRGGV